VSFATDIIDIGVWGVSRILKNRKNGKVHSPGLQSPQSTHRLRNTVAKRTKLS